MSVWSSNGVREPGPDAVGLLKACDGARIEGEEFFDAGEQVVAFVHIHARPKHGGPEVETRSANVWTVRDGLATSMTGYTRADALKAVGLEG